MLSNEEIKKCLAEYGVDATAGQCERIRAYTALLLKWNRVISLTSFTDEAEILRFHFAESVFAASAVSGMIGRLADVGAGAGFPGLPLRIVNDGIEPILLESNGKKCAFLNEVVRQLELTGVQVIHSRYEQAVAPGQIDVVVSRALGSYEELLAWSAGVLAPGGRVILWLGADDAEALVSGSRWLWQPKILIPGSTRRYLLVGWPPVSSRR